MNMEMHQNIKLDYLNFRGENISRFFHRVASKNDEILEKKMVANILQLQHEIGDNRVIPLAQAEFGILRGEVLSTMTCEEKQYKVAGVNKSQKCGPARACIFGGIFCQKLGCNDFWGKN